jgi:hypothetical protein
MSLKKLKKKTPIKEKNSKFIKETTNRKRKTEEKKLLRDLCDI